MTSDHWRMTNGENEWLEFDVHLVVHVKSTDQLFYSRIEGLLTQIRDEVLFYNAA